MPGQAKLEDSNVANIGGKDHKNAVAEVAANAEEWKGAGDAVGIEVWRIEKFKVVRVADKKTWGTFFSGDSYIVLNTYLVEEKKCYNVHFWLGQNSTQDEMGTAAYKTVELDTLLGDLPVQYREVQHHESQQFLKLFKNQVTYLEGGVDSGFNIVKPTEYKARLMHFTGKKKIRVEEMPLEFKSLNVGDTFLLDNGLELIQYNGSGSAPMERRKAQEIVSELKEARLGRATLTILDGEEAHPTFWTMLGGGPDGVAAATPDTKSPPAREKKMFQISDDTGPAVTTTEKKFELKSLDNDDVFVVDAGRTIFIWIGRTASTGERREAMKHATNYLNSASLPLWTPIVRVTDGNEPAAFKKLFPGM